jgi:hypothetical protein
MQLFGQNKLNTLLSHLVRLKRADSRLEGEKVLVRYAYRFCEDLAPAVFTRALNAKDR